MKEKWLLTGEYKLMNVQPCSVMGSRSRTGKYRLRSRRRWCAWTQSAPVRVG
ncbi:hypothetical protein MA6G0728R_4418 [Mycobacteroides abscessus 6G-0728-R]|nr:hypothetical protein MA6G0125S_4492 [Mycobacteroides abscessus 6G-0125-S]EIU95603.1 hypothetical protein MA6G0728R_4418 [Mycobacteroides abscessus 6G-0728-R]EUA75686.1 hypothetical protein I541_3271 [Mycobacteroides abscessus]EUA80618.1 hypothetical protein I544_1915 [Mycobacteroides abscessus subsp. bolletii 103]